MLELAESLLEVLGGSAAAAAAAATPVPDAGAYAEPKQPLRDSLSSANDITTTSRSSLGSEKAAPKLSGQEQDAVVAKIRSAVKMSASPEKKLPFQDDDTPNSKGARLKKEMEVRAGESGVRVMLVLAAAVNEMEVRVDGGWCFCVCVMVLVLSAVEDMEGGKGRVGRWLWNGGSASDFGCGLVVMQTALWEEGKGGRGAPRRVQGGMGGRRERWGRRS